MTIQLTSKYFSPLTRHPAVVGFLVAAGLVVWAGWVGYGFFVSPSPSEEDIAGQTVQLNVTGLQKITSSLTTYRTPATIPAVRDSLFTPPKP